ncbi:hypothetical protein PsorP6_007289 [Peronosclerospora sorghi]|uniref:Uncharacterized protein n=1 Tax=Peronosclerospora sorghi TaxID=230839 RepID=A0ACC0W9T4_9STRA|nr:hypothetical protein PsorP6_007289 [Peronosclerospora sorghi]
MNAMKIFRRFPSQHSDFIHDMSFDFYGKRLSHLHVWKIEWAPEFGQILASCSFDRTVSIWEDQGVYVHNPGAGPVATSDSVRAMSPHVPTIGCRDGWRYQAQLVDARDSVHDVKFSPRHLWLRLAYASKDGFVRMYEDIDVMNLSHWPLQEEFLADKDGAT